ncbi:CinA family nicotinamide mononucleotide deamidase-related protein [Desulfosarcina sp. OttesenSCG-928-A07]|nr:CinA family nicotinamide mononucleotide deamidase-related protein [Desulfosarcina sp. OttesenSCG-928-G17]MDL2329286.1 CinA family nicotinamide mononucleotide deamidase-related protein [Desulfosarcina sp. OttesenSCG-928-A07]
MKAEILATGDEIRSGTLVDTNSAYIAEILEDSGIPVVRHTTVGDSLDDLVTAITEISRRADVAVVTGGLGPTLDDRSAEAAARAAGVDLVFDPLVWETIQHFFTTIERAITTDRGIPASNKKQAFFPAGSRVIDNTIGTAPGFAISINRCRFYFLPGVPYEMKRMLKDDVISDMMSGKDSAPIYHRIKTISIVGLSEAVAGEKTAAVETLFPGVILGLRASFPQMQVKLYARHADPEFLDHQIKEATAWTVNALGPDHVISENAETMETVLGKLLIQHSATLAVAESCTGGLIAHWLTNVAGSSAYFLFSGVTYANAAKIDVLGVNPETIAQHGAVSEPTVREMADGVRRVGKSTFGLATSGVAGPDGGSPDKPMGTVCIGVSGPNGTFSRTFYFPFKKRRMNKEAFALAALNLLRRELLAFPASQN